MINGLLAALLEEMGDLLELKDDNVFRIRAFRRAAEVVAAHPVDIGTLTRAERLAIPGIGKGIADLIEEFQAKGQVAEHVKLRAAFPEGVLKMLKVQGLGPRRAAMLFKELKIDSLAKLQAAAQSGRLQVLKGFGEKMEQSILTSLAFADEANKRMILYHARQEAGALLLALKKSPAIKNLTLAGSLRRWKETVGDFDFLCTSSSPQVAIDEFLKEARFTRVLASGETKASGILPSGFQCDFRVVEEKSFGAALLYFTGSKEHNVRLREIAQAKNLTLNEYGLFRQSDKKQTKPVAGKTEEEVYAALGLDWIPPELREDRGEVQAAQKKKLPKLVELKDVRGDFHNHTDESDGDNSLEEMAEAARARGWSWFYSGDHSPSLTIANGLKPDRLRRKMAQVKLLDKKWPGFHVLTSSEVDILSDGKMDYSDEVLASLDCVIASVHSRFKQTETEMTDRIIRALENPHVDILGHLTGRRLNQRDGYALNIEKVLESARDTETAVEINGQPERSELRDIYVKQAIEMGVMLALNTDAHAIGQLDYMEYAVHIARRGWAEPKHLLNCRDVKDVRDWFNRNP